MIKSVAKPFHASDLEEQRGQRRRETVYREEEGCGWRARTASDLGGKGRWGRPFLIMVLLFMQTDTCQKAKRLTNVSGPDDCPWVGGVRHINQSNTALPIPVCQFWDQGQPAASKPWRIKLGFILCAG